MKERWVVSRHLGEFGASGSTPFGCAAVIIAVAVPHPLLRSCP